MSTSPRSQSRPIQCCYLPSTDEEEKGKTIQTSNETTAIQSHREKKPISFQGSPTLSTANIEDQSGACSPPS